MQPFRLGAALVGCAALLVGPLCVPFAPAPVPDPTYKPAKNLAEVS
jgi:hypothetical protein